MNYARALINISEWTGAVTSERARAAISEFGSFLIERGYNSLEVEFGRLLETVFGIYVDQGGLREVGRGHYMMGTPTAFTTLFWKDELLFFVDVERSDSTSLLELEIVTRSDVDLEPARTAVIEDAMKCFGLTSAKVDIVRSDLTESEFFRDTLFKELVVTPPLDAELFQRLKEKADRSILMELKKRGSVLERDIGELPLDGVSTARVKKTLDYFSGKEYGLVDRRHALVCKKTNEIVFLLKEKKDVENVGQLECPKCSRVLADEAIFAYYERTEKLKQLLDGNRWMPLLVKDAFVSAGVPEGNILVEAKYGEDEIDLLVFYRGRIFVVEVKDRPVSINDAYKLSAKTSRLESVITKKSRAAIADSERLSGRFEFGFDIVLSDSMPLRTGMFIPLVISTQDIGKDAKELLVDTKELAQTLEHCEEHLQDFVGELIREINVAELKQRLDELALRSDSPSYLAHAQFATALSIWQGGVLNQRINPPR